MPELKVKFGLEPGFKSSPDMSPVFQFWTHVDLKSTFFLLSLTGIRLGLEDNTDRNFPSFALMFPCVCLSSKYPWLPLVVTSHWGEGRRVPFCSMVHHSFINPDLPKSSQILCMVLCDFGGFSIAECSPYIFTWGLMSQFCAKNVLVGYCTM